MRQWRIFFTRHVSLDSVSTRKHTSHLPSVISLPLPGTVLHGPWSQSRKCTLTSVFCPFFSFLNRARVEGPALLLRSLIVCVTKNYFYSSWALSASNISILELQYIRHVFFDARCNTNGWIYALRGCGLRNPHVDIFRLTVEALWPPGGRRGLQHTSLWFILIILWTIKLIWILQKPPMVL